MADFESALSRGDGIAVTDYQTDSSLVSTFNLTDSSPAKLAAPSASDITNSSTVLTFTGVDTNASQVTVYGTKGAEAAPTTKSPVLATATTDADPKTTGFQVKVTGLTAGTTYHVAGTQTVDGDESVISDATDVATKSAAAQPATITGASLYNDAVPTGAATMGDQWLVQTSEDVTASGGYALIDLTDANGDTIQVRCDDDAAATANSTTDGITEAKCDFGSVDSNGVFTKNNPATTSGKALLIQLLQNAEDRNTGGGATYPSTIEYPLTVTKVQNVVDVNDGLPLDLTNSTDKTIG